MKKFGFTLSEIIITLTVIGVLASITAPLLSNIIPDKDKVKVLKVYKTLTDINTQLLEDRGAYFPSEICTGLGCTEEVSSPDLKISNDKAYLNSAKYLSLLTDKLELEEPVKINSSDESVTFTTVDGIQWTLETDGPSNGKIEYELTVDLDLSNSSSVSFSSSNQTNIDSFIFNIDTNGKVTGQDQLTRAYLANPHKMNDKKNDYVTAKSNLPNKQQKPRT